jgi:hypothetical protein
VGLKWDGAFANLSAQAYSRCLKIALACFGLEGQPVASATSSRVIESACKGKAAEMLSDPVRKA